MENTAEMTRQTYRYMQEIIQPGLTEMEFAGMFETYARKLGHGARIRVRHYQTEGYPWHILSGRSGSMPGLLDSPASGEGTSAAFPVGAGHKKLRTDEPIMVDLGSVLNGYHLDETRMLAIDSMRQRYHLLLGELLQQAFSLPRAKQEIDRLRRLAGAPAPPGRHLGRAHRLHLRG